ncbi:MAG: hypothetical protein ACFFD4_08635 [Candidatus Odinarchaeota archaeon]
MKVKSFLGSENESMNTTKRVTGILMCATGVLLLIISTSVLVLSFQVNEVNVQEFDPVFTDTETITTAGTSVYFACNMFYDNDYAIRIAVEQRAASVTGNIGDLSLQVNLDGNITGGWSETVSEPITIESGTHPEQVEETWYFSGSGFDRVFWNANTLPDDARAVFTVMYVSANPDTGIEVTFEVYENVFQAVRTVNMLRISSIIAIPVAVILCTCGIVLSRMAIHKNQGK